MLRARSHSEQGAVGPAARTPSEAWATVGPPAAPSAGDATSAFPSADPPPHAGDAGLAGHPERAAAYAPEIGGGLPGGRSGPRLSDLFPDVHEPMHALSRGSSGVMTYCQGEEGESHVLNYD